MATTAVMMTATSAFAESRHREATRSESNSSRQTGRNRASDRVQRSDRSPAPTSRSQSFDRSTSTQRFDNRSNAGRQQSNSSYRNDGYRNNGNRNDSGYRNEGARGGRQTFEGHVTRIAPYNGGYRVWLDRGGYPFFIPEARFRLFPLRLGLSIRFGGFWDPLGYYNVYDVGPYGGGPYYGGGYATSGDVRGVVESVDYRRGTLVLRDDISGSFVTTVLRGNDPRLGDLRPGDYVDLGGSWNRSGVFEAYNVVDIRGGAGYDNRNDNRYDNRNDNPDGRY